MGIRILDTKSGQKREFVPVHEGRVGMYLCGMTVQDRPHVGHMRSAIVGDVVRRYFEHRGFEVTFVYNFTDVDDKIIAKGAEEGLTFQQISERNIAAFFDVADKLNIKRATHYPRATEHISEILAMIGELVERGLAYAEGGDVYFRVTRFESYGDLSGRRIEELQSGARIEIGEHKENPLDFTLWKGAKPGEPAWDSPWGPGRPGWHIECSAMSRRYLGETFDIHGGGMDLIFPHHENEIAQSEGATGKPFARFWMHNGMVNLGGEKMSKSTRHFFLAEDILRAFDPGVVRYYLMSTHYRSPIEFTEERLTEAGQAHRRLVNAIAEAERVLGAAAVAGAGTSAGASAEARRLEAAFHEAMDDDFNSARALGHLFELAREVNRTTEAAGSDADRLSQVAGSVLVLRNLAGVLGLRLDPGQAEAEIPAEVEQLFAERQQARKDRNFALADRLRGEIESRGFRIEDRPDGSRIVPGT